MNRIYINNEEDFIKLYNLPIGGEYIIVLCNDLDFKGYDVKPIDLVDTNVILDGNFHEIKNLCIRNPKKDYVGLFNVCDSIMAVKDLRLSGNVEGNENVGLLAGIFNGYINNCSFNGNVIGHKNVGGLIGKSDTILKISDCKLDLMACGEDEKSSGYITGVSNKLIIHSCSYNSPCHELSGIYDQIDIKPPKSRKIFK